MDLHLDLKWVYHSLHTNHISLPPAIIYGKWLQECGPPGYLSGIAICNQAGVYSSLYMYSVVAAVL